MIMNRLRDFTIQVLGRDYDLGYALCGDGGPGLFLLNRKTPSLYPLGWSNLADDVTTKRTNVEQIDGAVEKLSRAGIIRVIGDIPHSKVGHAGVRCEIVHPEIVNWLNRAVVDAKNGRQTEK